MNDPRFNQDGSINGEYFDRAMSRLWAKRDAEREMTKLLENFNEKYPSSFIGFISKK